MTAPARRGFLAALGTLSMAGVLPRAVWSQAPPGSIPRGVAQAPGDFMFAPGLIYLQTGSMGPTPRPVMEQTIAAWRALELNPTAVGYGEQEHAMDAVRATAARFLNCTTDELVLTRSTSEGMNWTAQGIAFQPGDRILTTDQEHPGGRSCWDYVARRHGVVLDIVTIPPGENDRGKILDAFTRLITPRTRVLSFSHLLSSTGLRMPVDALSALGRGHDCIVVVDGAQAAGNVPVDVKALGCHVYATSGHKWMLGPKGTGLLYLSEELGRMVDPIALEGGRAAYSNSSGVTSIPSVLGLGAAIDYISAIGSTEIERHNLALRNRLFAALASVPKLRVVSAPPGPLASPLLSFTLPDSVESRAFQLRMLQQHQIMLKMVPKNWFNGIRVSTHLFNSEQDVDRLVTALTAELA